MRVNLRSFVLAAFLLAPVFAIGCAGSVGVGYRVYDPYRADYHVWDSNEGVYYNQWAVSTHRDPHRDYRKLKRADQSEYWKWRHDQMEHH
jgi:hypothetical protein